MNIKTFIVPKVLSITCSSLTKNCKAIAVYWHMVNDYVGGNFDVHQMQLSPSKGRHRVTVVDEMGNSLAMEFGVE